MRFLGADGSARKRAEQQLEFTWALVRDELAERLRRSPGVAAIRDEVRAAVLAGELLCAGGCGPAACGLRRGLSRHVEGPVTLTLVSADSSSAPASTAKLMERALARVDELTEELLDLRRDLHAHPELSWHEERTTERGRPSD